MKRGNSFSREQRLDGKDGEGREGGKKEERQGCFNGFESASK